jgi:hypothetical protein
LLDRQQRPGLDAEQTRLVLVGRHRDQWLDRLDEQVDGKNLACSSEIVTSSGPGHGSVNLHLAAASSGWTNPRPPDPRSPRGDCQPALSTPE